MYTRRRYTYTSPDLSFEKYSEKYPNLLGKMQSGGNGFIIFFFMWS